MATANETLISSTKVVAASTGVDLVPHKAIWVGTGGNLAVTLRDGTTVTIPGVASGTLLPLEVKQIGAGSTAAGFMLWT